MLPGTWYDGRASRGRPVQVSRAMPGMLRIEADGETVDWPVAEIVASPRLGGTPRVLRRPGHGQVECPDSPLLDQWGLRQSSRIEAFADWLERRRLAIAGAAVLAVAGTVGFLQFGVPLLAREVAERLPHEAEQVATDQAMRLLEHAYFKPTRVPEARQAALRAGFATLVAGEPRATQMRLGFARSPVLGPNAFALPDGRIFLTDAMLDLAGSDAELLAVLAHEAGHHVHRHGMRSAIESSSVVLLAALLMGDVSGSSLAVSIPAVLVSNGFSRGHEREADAYAFDLLRRRGRDPADFARVMERLARRGGDAMDEGVAGYLSTHPPTPERIRAARAAATPGGPDRL